MSKKLLIHYAQTPKPGGQRTRSCWPLCDSHARGPMTTALDGVSCTDCLLKLKEKGIANGQ